MLLSQILFLNGCIESINQADEGDYTALEAVIQQGIETQDKNSTRLAA